MPDVPREQIDEFIDHTEREHRRQQAPRWVVPLLRAYWAAHLGDEPVTQRWADEWHVAGPMNGEYGVGTISMESHFAAQFNVEAGLGVYETKMPQAEREDADDDVTLVVGAAVLRSMLGDTQGAVRDVHALIDRHGLETVTSLGEADDLIRALEGDPATAEYVVRKELETLKHDEPDNFLEYAAIARHRLLQDPVSPEGRQLAEQAEHWAAMYDRRNGTPFQSRLLQSRWFGDL